MALLVTRRGDTQGLKASLSSELSGSALLFQFASDISSVRSTGASNPFGTNVIAYRGPSASSAWLTDANAIAKHIGGVALSPTQSTLAIAGWIDWEAKTLRPAMLLASKYIDDLHAAFHYIESALHSDGGSFLVGDTVTLADVVIFSCLFSVQAQLPAPSLKAYMDRLASDLKFKAALQAVGCSQEDPKDMAATDFVLREDAKEMLASRPKLPIPGQRNILITSALPYVNNVPHLGNIIGCVLSADCYSRFCRARGYNSIFVCGTDEYGTATETKALEEGMTADQICDKYHAIHKSIYEWFDIGFDKFGRTPSRWQTRICQSIFKLLEDKGCLVEQSMEQLYSEALGKFLADRFVVGTCPKCKYDDARGDQCDQCGTLLDPTELIRPKCKFSGTEPVIRSTSHIFLDLPQLSPKLQEYIDTASQMGGWSSNCVQVTAAWMRDGLKNRCITRDLKWGTPVPRVGFENKVFYVWFDAPIGYISITANYTPDWERWWKSPDDVEMVQFMGKDNVPFHTVIFPATLLGTGDQWTLMKNISVTEYLNYEGGKFSKSRGTGVFGNDAKETGIPVEVWRYYLLSNRPEQQDTDFKWSDLAARNNSELLANMGNFANRSLQFVVKFFDGKIPAVGVSSRFDDSELLALGALVNPKVKEYVAAMEKIKIRDGVRIAMSISADGNKFIQDTQPWVVVKTDKERCAGLVAAAVGLVRLLAVLLNPYMPSLAQKLLSQLALPEEALLLSDELIEMTARPHTLFEPGHAIGVPAPLVTMIPEEQIEQLRGRFGGNQAEREAKAAANTSSSAAGATLSPSAHAAGGERKKNPAASAAAGGGGGGGGGDGSKKKVVEKEGPVDVSRLDLRVGLIKSVKRHPDADSLYVEEIDLGESDGPRQVVSGLVKYMSESDLQGKLVVCVCNLKPAAMRGVTSQAMVMAATSPPEGGEKAVVELVEPPAESKPGERIVFEGYLEGQPDEQLNPKKKVFESVQPDFSVGEDLVARYKGVAFMTSSGPCRVKSVKGASIK